MSLQPGEYDILVDHSGYNPARQWVAVRDQDVVIDMRLDRRQTLPSVQTDMTSEQPPAPGPKVAVGTYTLPGEITNSLGMQFVRIAPGTFQMGSTASGAGEDQQPVHPVEITQSFYLGKYEVTQSQWEAVMGNNPSPHKGDNQPVVRVSWVDVQVFIRKLNARERGSAYRLPTEAEWEYATRSGLQTAYGFGDSSHQLNQYAWYGGNSAGQPHSVGQLKANSWGLYDLHGNVWEWSQDWYGETYYPSSPHRNPQGPSSGSHRVVRGGSWSSGSGNCRSASRGHWPPDFRSDYVGFRLLRTAQ
jgi:formylglycine-generating enzyme required for sulfatase activity